MKVKVKWGRIKKASDGQHPHTQVESSNSELRYLSICSHEIAVLQASRAFA